MEEKNYKVVGVMSGTSLDGIDCAFATISLGKRLNTTHYPSFQALMGVAETIAYAPEWKERLQHAHTLSEQALKELNIDYTIYLSEVIKTFIKSNKLTDIDFVCSHGHTVLHNPTGGYTFQIGNLPSVAKLVEQKVVCDFRVQDVALGGQGAPLVPIGDHLLFNEYDFCLNLGGFANVSTEDHGIRSAYDICPVNVVLNKYARLLGKEYDNEGLWARSGSINTGLLARLNDLPFYQEKSPKSLGIEWVHQNIFPVMDVFDLQPIDMLSTFTEHIAIQLGQQFQSGASVLVTGGGAYNKYLMERVRFRKSVQLVIPNNDLVDFKEALIFGLLGVLKVEGLPNCLSSVTGAEKDHSSGVIFEF